MSMGAGLAIGMGSGLACGIAAGMASGRKRACDEIREYAQKHGTTIQNADGRTLSVDEFLSAAASTQSQTPKKIGGVAAGVIVAVVGLLVLAGLLALFYLRSQGV